MPVLSGMPTKEKLSATQGKSWQKLKFSTEIRSKVRSIFKRYTWPQKSPLKSEPDKIAHLLA